MNVLAIFLKKNISKDELHISSFMYQAEKAFGIAFHIAYTDEGHRQYLGYDTVEQAVQRVFEEGKHFGLADITLKKLHNEVRRKLKLV